MNIDLKEFLSEEQKRQIGRKIFDKIVSSLDNIKTSESQQKKTDKTYHEIVIDILQGDYLLDDVDLTPITDKLIKRVTDKI